MKYCFQMEPENCYLRQQWCLEQNHSMLQCCCLQVGHTDQVLELERLQSLKKFPILLNIMKIPGLILKDVKHLIYLKQFRNKSFA